MIINHLFTDRAWLVPDVLCPTAKESGVAALNSVLQGFDLPTNPHQLKQVLPFEVENRSIDTLEEAARELGLDAEQIMVPADFILSAEANILPAIVAVRQLSGRTNFVVIWRQHGPFLQIMDPLSGRRWVNGRRFLNEVYIHTTQVPAVAWQTWATSAEFQQPLAQYLRKLEFTEADINRLINTALDQSNWYSMAVLDAATRLVTTGLRTKTITSTQTARDTLERLFEQVQSQDSAEGSTDTIVQISKSIPLQYWSVLPFPDEANDLNQEEQQSLLLRGAVLLQISGRLETVPTVEAEETSEDMGEEVHPTAVSQKKAEQVDRQLWNMLWMDGLFTPKVLALAVVTAAIGVTIEAVLFQGIMRLGQYLNLFGQRFGAVGIIIVFFLLLVILEISMSNTSLHLGRRLEARLRIAFLEKVPRLSSEFFYGRPIADLVNRAYSIQPVRHLPNIGIEFLQLTFQALFTAIGIIWIDPSSLVFIIIALITMVILMAIFSPMVGKRTLQFRIQLNNLMRYPLDALAGSMPIRTHGAERAVRRAFESNLVKWTKAYQAYGKSFILAQSTVALVYACFSAAVIFSYIARGGDTEKLLLLAYWALILPDLLRRLATTAIVYPYQRAIATLVFDQINAPEEFDNQGQVEDETTEDETTTEGTPPVSKVVDIAMENVKVEIEGHTILQDINLAIQAGEHVGIVGPSGAGKSTLIGLILGFYQASAGQVQINGEALNLTTLKQLRRRTAWVDPGVQVWNRSFLENLEYGTESTDSVPLMTAIDQADLFTLLEQLPDGFNTFLGEAGGFVSGGEGQRVRLGRAMMRSQVQLAILDEPFRGLDRPKRRELLARAREYWRDATLICITHDVGEIRAFERVLVVDDGRIIEDAAPEILANQPDSRYAKLLRAEEATRQGLWSATNWRRLWLEKGRLQQPHE